MRAMDWLADVVAGASTVVLTAGIAELLRVGLAPAGGPR